MADPRTVDHYLYVLAFSDDVVKVGYSKDWNRRLMQHRATARTRGAKVVNGWLSDSHEYADVIEGEKTLKAFCRERWPRAWGSEWFARADFAQVAKHAEGLNDVLLIFAGRADHLLAKGFTAA